MLNFYVFIIYMTDKLVGGYSQMIGSRRQVFNGTAKKTGYGKSGLTKKHLKMNKHGHIVSIKKSKASRKNKNLGKFLQKRGSKTFGPVLSKKAKRKGKKMGGGGDHDEELHEGVHHGDEEDVTLDGPKDPLTPPEPTGEIMGGKKKSKK
jgi:hypothetical protein